MEIFRKDLKITPEMLELHGRNEKSFAEDVEIIKNWLQTQPHLPEQTDEKKIKNFLLMNKCSIEKAKQRIDMYYTVRSIVPEFFQDTNPNSPIMKDSRTRKECIVLHPHLIENQYRVIFCKKTSSEPVSAKLSVMNFFNIQELRLDEDVMFGDIFVLDTKNETLENMMSFTPTLISKTVMIYEKVYSLRIQAIYIVNTKPFADIILNLLKKLLKPKMFDRIHLHKDDAVLNTIFPKKLLPRDYQGGEGPSLKEMNEMMDAKFMEYRDRFDKLDELRVNEDLRPEKLNNDDILGFYGNFKKLEVD